ncbi:MAG: thioredoxin domain-containing protein [Pseudomonadota bacterium]
MNRKILFAAGLLLVGGGLFLAIGRGAFNSASAQEAYAGEPEILAATFASAWCSSCKILEPRLAKVMPAFRDQPVKFIDLDFTFGKTKAHQELAAENGFEDAYERFKSGTGYTLLIDAQTGDVIDVITMNHSAQAMRAAIAQAIAVAAVAPTETQSSDNP